MTVTAVLTVTDPADDTFDYQCRLQPNGDWHVFHGLKSAGVIKLQGHGYQAWVGDRFGALFAECDRRIGWERRDIDKVVCALHQYWDELAKLYEAEVTT